MANTPATGDQPGLRADVWARGQLIDWAAGTDGKDFVKRRLYEDLDRYAAELAGPAPTAVERTLVESIAQDWLFLRVAQANLAGRYAAQSGPSLALGDHFQKLTDRAHRRLMRSIKTLATIRRLASPAVQVNVAAVATACASAPPPPIEATPCVKPTFDAIVAGTPTACARHAAGCS